MKKIIFIFLLLTASLLSSFAQKNTIFDGWTKEELFAANTAEKVGIISNTEKEIICLCNLARADGEKFWNVFLSSRIADQDSKNVESLKADLFKTKNIAPLRLDAGLCKAAAAHAEDMGNTGKIGSNSSTGTPYTERILKYYGSDSKIVGENCVYGNESAEDIVIQMLVDEGMPQHPHRFNILSPIWKSVGVATRQHKSWQWNTVLDFGTLVVESAE